MLNKTFSLTFALLLACASSAVQAHQVWIENTKGQARLYFGEYGDDLRETSPGRLDEFTGVPAMELRAATQTRTVAGRLTREAFVYDVPDSAETLFAEASYPLIERTASKRPPLLWRLAARWTANPVRPVAASAALDLVPTGKVGELRAIFQGAPLAKAQVTIIAPSGWSREALTSADGIVRFDLPWRGQYVAEVKHRDKRPGERDGRQYGEVSYLTTLTFVQASGVRSPARPGATPGGR
ncbi:MAG: TonB-dependent receptor [Burkholderiaceae bacterium]